MISVLGACWCGLNPQVTWYPAKGGDEWWSGAPWSLPSLFQDAVVAGGGGGVLHLLADSSSQAAPTRGDRRLLYALLILSSAKATFPDIGSNFLGCRTDALGAERERVAGWAAASHQSAQSTCQRGAHLSQHSEMGLLFVLHTLLLLANILN